MKAWLAASGRSDLWKAASRLSPKLVSHSFLFGYLGARRMFIITSVARNDIPSLGVEKSSGWWASVVQAPLPTPPRSAPRRSSRSRSRSRSQSRSPEAALCQPARSRHVLLSNAGLVMLTRRRRAARRPPPTNGGHKFVK